MPFEFHTKRDEANRPLVIYRPHKPGLRSNGIETFTPGRPSMASTKHDPSVGVNRDIPEPDLKLEPKTHRGAGVIMLDKDENGHATHAWVVSPTNGFGPSTNTFPKGGHEMTSPSLQHTACKEVHEETGMIPKITGHLTDQVRSKGQMWGQTCRWYVGERHSGTPSDMGWETQAVHRVPIHKLVDFVDHQEKPIARMVVEKYGPPKKDLLGDLLNGLLTSQSK